MPRGKPGTGPFARKRLQTAVSQPTDIYMRLPLSEQETRVVYEVIQMALATSFGKPEGFELQNVAYRITEHAAAIQLGLPVKLPPHEYENGSTKKKRGRTKRR